MCQKKGLKKNSFEALPNIETMIIDFLNRTRYHIGYYRLTKRFLKIDLPSLSKTEKNEIRKVWKGVHIYDMDFVNARVYKKIHGFSPYYLSPCWYNELRALFNPKDHLYSLENKAMCDVYFPELKFPEPFVRRLNGNFFDKDLNYISREQAKNILHEKKVFVIKPSVGTEQGEGVVKVNLNKNIDLDMVFHQTGKDFVAQALVSQAPEIKRLNPSSLNCFRVTTMYFNGRFGYSTALKVGKKGSFRDNWNSAYWIDVDSEGILNKFGYDYNLNPVENSDNGISFRGIQMPKYREMIVHLEAMHKKLFPNCGVIGWDVTIDDNYEVCVIETNLWDPGTNIEQFVSGDFFRPFRDDMLAYLNIMR